MTWPGPVDSSGLLRPDDGREKGAALLEAASRLLGVDDDRAYELATLAAGAALESHDGLGAATAGLLLGRLQVRRGESESARQHFEAAIERYDGQGQRSGGVETRHALAYLLLELGEFPAAAAQVQAALSINVDSAMGAELRNLLAGIHHSNGQYAQALTELESVLEVHRVRDYVPGQVKVLGNLGYLLTSLGRYPEALQHLTRAYTLIVGTPDLDAATLRLRGHLLINLGRVHLDMNDPADARKYFHEALDFARASEDRLTEATAVLNLATAEHELGELDSAHERYGQALELARAVQSRQGEVSALDGLGRVLLAWGQDEAALIAFREAEQIALDTEDLEGQLDVLLHLGELQVRQDAGAATQTLERALRVADEVGRPKTSCDALRVLYRLYASSGQTDLAFKHLELLYHRERDILNAEVEERVREVTARFDVERAQHQAELHRLRMVTAEEARAVAEAEVRERTHSLELAQLEVVTRLAVAAEYRDDTTGEHTQRVGQHSAAIAARLGLPAEEVDLLKTAARLHDVGKIGIPDSILLKAGALSAAEYERMKTHTLIGARILSGGQSRLLHMAENIARAHHERWDGSGYPAGLSGEAIPLVARIVAVADVFDALVHSRPYKEAWKLERALAEIAAQAGQHFDPNVVRGALEVLRTPRPDPPLADALPGPARDPTRDSG
jgi:response regulator RpfG family c-di-GMP phosphodiesterase/Tfp pilus assembly protein PilF